MDYNITAESLPDYDAWGPDTYWSCQDWITWHSQLKKKHGGEKANTIWLEAWNRQDSFESNFNWCKYSSFFNDFLKKENIRGISHVLADVVTGAGDVLSGAASAASKTGKTASKTADLLSVLIPVVVILAVAAASYYVYKKYLQKA